MVKITYMCDCCKCIVQEDKLCRQVRASVNCNENRPWSVNNFQSRDGRHIMDLCNICYKNFLDYIDTFLLKEGVGDVTQ